MNNNMLAEIKPIFRNETEFQSYIFKRIWNEVPKSRRLIWAVPNGAKRTRFEQIIAKATGVIAGVFDLHCYYKGKFYIIELKFGKNTKSKEQKEWEKLMIEQGAISYTFYETQVDELLLTIKNIFE